MKKLILILLGVVCCVSFISSAYAAKLKRGDVVYARSNLRSKVDLISWHSMGSSPIVVPVGTEVSIKARGHGIAFVVTDTNNWYSIDTETGTKWDKFFVKDKKEIGLESLPSDKRSQIENGIITVGMTKEEVYASRGCPAYIAWGKTTERSSFADIMQSDKWYYMKNQRGKDVMVVFNNGVVAKIGGFEK